MNVLRVIYAISGLILLAAASMAFWPVSAPELPASDFAKIMTKESPKELRFQSLAARFDRTDLPDPAPPEPVAAARTAPPPDPAKTLRRYRYLGMAASDGRKAAVFENAGTTRILKPGDPLEGFALTAFDETSAQFELEGRKVNLSLAQDARP